MERLFTRIAWFVGLVLVQTLMLNNLCLFGYATPFIYIYFILILDKDIDRNGYKGIGKPEPLKGDFSGYWSRRIDDYHRIVYKIQDGEMYIAYCGTHYHK